MKVNSQVNETQMKPLTWLNQWTTHLWQTETWIPWWMKPWWNQKPCASETRGSELTGEWNPKEITKMCTSDTWESVLTRDETLSKPVWCTLETHENWTHWWMKPWGKHMHLWQMESELTGEWNPKEITKTCTSDTWESVLTGHETLRKPVNHAPLKDRKVHSQVNESMMKPQNHEPLTHGKANSLVNETLKKPVNHAPVKHGKLQSLLNETLKSTKQCTSETRQGHSLVNKTMMKPVNCAPLKHVKVNSLVKKSIK